MNTAVNKKIVAPTRIFWTRILVGLAILIGSLLAAILWKMLIRESSMPVKISGPAIQLAGPVITGWQDDTPINLMASYYQAIQNGNASQVQAAWEAPSSRSARYAAQVVRESSANKLCQLRQMEQVTPTNTSEATLNIVLECNSSKRKKIYHVVFYLKTDKTGAWKIVSLRDVKYI